MSVSPKLGEKYRAGCLPPRSVVRTGTGTTEYVIGRRGLCMRWEQPIPGSEEWRVEYAGRLADGEWMTPRERAEVDEVRGTNGQRIELDGVRVFLARNDDGEVTIGIDTEAADRPTGREWPHLYVWLNDATLHAPEGEPRDVTEVRA